MSDTRPSHASGPPHLFEAIPHAVVILDADDRVVRVNPAFTNLFGHTAAQATGQPLTAQIVPAGRSEESVDLNRRALTGERVVVRSVRQRRDGTPIDVDVTAACIAADPKCVYVAYDDVSVRQDLATAYRTIVEKSLHGLAILQDGRIALCNAAFASCLQCTVAEARAATRIRLPLSGQGGGT